MRPKSPKRAKQAVLRRLPDAYCMRNRDTASLPYEVRTHREGMRLYALGNSAASAWKNAWARCSQGAVQSGPRDGGCSTGRLRQRADPPAG